MSPHEITFVVEGGPGQLSLDVVSEAFEAFKTFLQGTGNASWVLGSLAVGSACLGAAISDLSQEEPDSRFQEIIEGIESIESGAEAPASWSTHALGGLVKMAGIGNRRDAKREFGLIDEATKRPVADQFSENDLE